MNANSVPFMRSGWPQRLLRTRWVKNGRVMWFASVAGTTSKASP
uniref:Ribosomal protein S6 n=1 Tax=Myotis myotis TaxID=51298 RepID=A0A7J7URE3_MYOMY|nr:ribosomal protein S6 [Myotis myotis]